MKAGHLVTFEHVIESWSATPKSAGRPRNDTGVIRHAFDGRVKRFDRFAYHCPPGIRRVEFPACLGSDPNVTV